MDKTLKEKMMLGQILTSILRFLSVNVYRTSGNGLLITKRNCRRSLRTVGSRIVKMRWSLSRPEQI